MTTTEHSEPDQPLAVPLSDQLGLLVERLLKYSDLRRNDPRENREALRDLIVGELADELQAVRKAERERLADKARTRADYEVTATAHHAGQWYAAMEWHTTRHAAMRDLIADVFKA
jgi:hypothetical protein